MFFDPFWPHLNDLACWLIDELCLLGYQNTLGVKILVLNWIPWEERADDEVFPPEFREKGRVRIPWEFVREY